MHLQLLPAGDAVKLHCILTCVFIISDSTAVAWSNGYISCLTHLTSWIRHRWRSLNFKLWHHHHVPPKRITTMCQPSQQVLLAAIFHSKVVICQPQFPFSHLKVQRWGQRCHQSIIHWGESNQSKLTSSPLLPLHSVWFLIRLKGASVLPCFFFKIAIHLCQIHQLREFAV